MQRVCADPRDVVLPVSAMKEFVIERATERDRPDIMSLLEQVNMHHIGTAEMPDITYENYFVAKVGTQVVGFCGYKIVSTTEAKTELMAVDQRFRGWGIGLALQTRRMTDMLDRGIRFVTTNTDLPETIAWYKKHFGYREVGRLPKVNEFSDPGVEYWTTLRADLRAWFEASKGGKDNG